MHPVCCKIEEGAGTAVIQHLKLNEVRLRQETPPSALWSQQEWDAYRAAPPVHILPFSPVADKIENAHTVLPMATNARARLVDTALSKPWLE
jgi:hypothetical protein